MGGKKTNQKGSMEGEERKEGDILNSSSTR